MKKIALYVSLFLIITIMFFNFPAHAGDKPNDKVGKQYVIDLNNVKCPMMDGNAKKDIYTIYNEKLYHFCCPDCIDKFMKEPVKYAKSVETVPADELAIYEIVGNDKCPILGNPVNKNISAIKDKKLYYFCCRDCINKFMNGTQVGTQSQPTTNDWHKKGFSRCGCGHCNY